MIIRVPNDNCGPEIDTWLVANAGYGGYKEWLNPFVRQPYRCFEIFDEELAIIFKLMWL